MQARSSEVTARDQLSVHLQLGTVMNGVLLLSDAETLTCGEAFFFPVAGVGVVSSFKPGADIFLAAASFPWLEGEKA